MRKITVVYKHTHQYKYNFMYLYAIVKQVFLPLSNKFKKCSFNGTFSLYATDIFSVGSVVENAVKMSSVN